MLLAAVAVDVAAAAAVAAALHVACCS